MARYYLNLYKKTLKPILKFLMVTLITLTVCFSVDLYRLYFQPMPLSKHDNVIFRIDKSFTAKRFAQILQTQHLIRSARVFLNVIRIQGVAKQLKAGVYQIKPGESAQQLLRRVVAGDVLKEDFSIIEGTTQEQIAKNLSKSAFLKYQESDWFDAVCHADSADQTITRIPGSDIHCQRAEIIRGNQSARVSHFDHLQGLFLADKYQYSAGGDAKLLLAQAHDLLKQYLMKAWNERDPGLPYKNPYEMLIVSSILEKETAILEERRLISGIIVNRLKHHMPLQMDPTVIYALGSAYTGKLTHDDLQVDSPYNSYRYRGLPPTPITMVGKEAIDAACHPTSSDYLYFVTKGDGTHIFSKSYEEQRQAIRTYIKSGNE